jgi:hypothetical protein
MYEIKKITRICIWVRWAVAHLIMRILAHIHLVWWTMSTWCQARHRDSKGHFRNVTESPWQLRLKHSHWWERRSPVHFRFSPRLRDQRSMWMHDGCKVYMDSYMASNGSCVMVTWIIFKNHLLEVCLTQNRETMALRLLTTTGSFNFIMCEEDPHE